LSGIGTFAVSLGQRHCASEMFRSASRPSSQWEIKREEEWIIC
jgi:hypothetical protein